MDAAFVVGLGLVVLLLWAVAIVVAVFYFITLQTALSRCAPRNRVMNPPGLVWISFIPIVNAVWAFFNAIQVPDSLKNEFRDRGMDDGSDYGKNIGLAGAITGAVWTVLWLLTRLTGSGAIAMLDGLVGLGWLVLFIIFWVKIAQYSGRLTRRSAYDDRFGDRDFDDRPRRDAGPVDARPADAYRQDDRNRIH